MKKFRTVAAGLTAVAASTVVLSATAQPAAAAWDSCDLSAKVNELRSWDTNDEYNILVWKESAQEHIDLKGVVLTDSAREKPCAFTNDIDDYHWAVFESGEFTRKGDGGYRNWAFYGTFDRVDDNRVVFTEH